MARFVKSMLTKHKYLAVHNVFLFLILIFSAYIRLYDIGYSHFYGDEIKTLYLRKDVSAYDFIMNQRKGPMQFLVSWFMEKMSNSYSEFWIRLPFALSGVLLIGVFYFYANKIYGPKTALIATSLFSLNGFYIAFSRTAQYQVLYLLLGFFSIAFSYYANCESCKKIKRHFYELLCGLFLGLSLLSHYDAIFFFIPVFYNLNKKSFLKVSFLALFLASLFYLPNILGGYFKSNTAGYILKRIEGQNYLKNNSLYTLFVYNPLFLYLGLVFLGFILFFIFSFNEKYKNLVVWFLAPFFVFQFLIINPGTHIHNYFLPAIFMSAVGLTDFYNRLVYGWLKKLYICVLVFSFCAIYAIQSWVYNPKFNTGYPWLINRPSQKYHLYLYGFPYYRGWDKVGLFLQTYGKPRNYYTNDNETVASYYLTDIPYMEPGNNFYPELYIEVSNPQQITDKKTISKDFYQEIKSFNGGLIKLYKLNRN